MFPKTKNIETVFQHMRLYMIVLIVSVVCFSGYVLHLSYKLVEKSQSRIYILASGKAMEAFARDRQDNMPVEARDHIRSFHQYFFTLDPDEKVIATNTGRALYLADGSAKRLYDNLKENGYYSGIISGNISQEITVDSIALDTHTYPYYFRCYARQRIIRPTSLVTRSLITEGWLRNSSRSDNNPHGFLIEKWGTLENKDLSAVGR
ncbi:conjugative transposon protein TraK [Flavitalea flava]